MSLSSSTSAVQRSRTKDELLFVLSVCECAEKTVEKQVDSDMIFRGMRASNYLYLPPQLHLSTCLPARRHVS